jgi:hypothetical protein
MPYSPHFSYFISPADTPVIPDSPLWRHPLPLSRHISSENEKISLCYGEYFSAVRNFLENDGCEFICRALTQRFQQKVKTQDLREIRIRLEKHGEFYHPACLEVLAAGHKIFFALNVAVSDMGIKIIKAEYHCLSELNAKFSLIYIPEVYGFSEIEFAGDRKIRMFLGHWFEGYNEFHVTKAPSDNHKKVLVWDDHGGRFYLSSEQSANLYRQAARILTYYYNVESFEQIFPWHHGAGDFVVKIDNGELDLKLITVRGYRPFLNNVSDLKNGEKDVELMLQALLLFFLNLSVRMRLDRYDGVGDVVWADGLAVQSTLDGFFEGLALKPLLAAMPDSLEKCFRYYLSVCTKGDLYDLCNVAVKTFNRRAPELRVVQQHLKAHVAELSRVIGQVN